MAKRKTARKSTSRKRGGAPKAKFAFPRVFHVVPVKAKLPDKHAHVLGQLGTPPCPTDSVYLGTQVINGVTYCVYRLQDHSLYFVEC